MWGLQMQSDFRSSIVPLHIGSLYKERPKYKRALVVLIPSVRKAKILGVKKKNESSHRTV